MISHKTYILGAGPAGLAAAYTLTQEHQSVVVIERNCQVGGLAKSIDYEGFILDYGPHFFSTDISSVLKLWNDVLGIEQVEFKRITRMYWRNKYFNYPPKPVEILSGVGLFESLKIILSFLEAKIFANQSPQNFAEKSTAKFGRYLFESCFSPYIEKLLGISCVDISADWQPGRIRNTSLIEIVKNILWKKDDGLLKFPKLGSRQLYERIFELLNNHNQEFFLSHEITRIEHKDFNVSRLIMNHINEQKNINIEGQVISSIPLTILLKKLSPLPPDDILKQVDNLKLRNTILVYLIVESGQLFLDQCIYINEPNIQIGRVTNFANWSNYMCSNFNRTPLCCEYWCDFSDLVWQKSEEEFINQAISDLKIIGLLQQQKISTGLTQARYI
jgi:protoporphyrinogen oxidase